MSTRLLEGSQAIAEAMVAAGCRFFAGYPMTPFTEVLEGMAELLPKVGGVCINAESEIEAVGMCWGASAGGVRAATGSVGQGLSLMQESLAELSQARLPLVVLNMARGQGDYFQATRGGGHGDYRHIVLAPGDLKEAVKLVQMAFHLADTWRNPVMFLGDYYLAHVQETVDTSRIDFGVLPEKTWALDGRSSGRPEAKVCSPIIITKRNAETPVAYGEHLQSMQLRLRELEQGVQPMFDAGFTEDAEVVVVAYGTPGRFVKHVVGKLRAEGRRIGYFRPITLWPFPSKALAEATRNARALAVYELNAGQMMDDVRLAVGSERVRFIGGISFDDSAFGIAPAMTVRTLGGLLQQTMEEVKP